MEYHPCCPTCDRPIGSKYLTTGFNYQISTPRGKMPSGSMFVSQDQQPCAGFAGYGTIVIRYYIPTGVQKKYHPNPGSVYRPINRTAYLPNTPEGRDLLKRLKHAFSHGLTFTVGTSLSSGLPNSVVWSSIRHKTSRGFGPFSYPDPSYFSNCNGELDRLRVPSAKDLP